MTYEVPDRESVRAVLTENFVGPITDENIDQRRLDNTRFVDCKLHGLIGTPRLEGPTPYTLENCDFSAAGDGSDVRTSLEPR